MRKAFGLLLVSIISSFAFSQTSPEMISPVRFKLEGRNYVGSTLSLDAYIKTNKEKCSTRVAEQMQILNKNKNFLSDLHEKVGLKLKEADSRCKYYRFEIIDEVTEDNSTAMHFAYRCYSSKTAKFPSDRVSQLKPVGLNPATYLRDEDEIEKDCDGLKIANKLNKQKAESNIYNDEPVKNVGSSSSGAPVLTKPKKGSSQN